MKNRLIFSLIYCFMIVIIYLQSIPNPKKVPDIGIKQSTIYLIKQFEGLKHEAYDDGYGNMTIGIGHYIKPDEVKLYYIKISTKQAHKLLESDMKPCERVLSDKVHSPLSQGQFDALMSFCHNIGPDNFAGSDVVRYINRENYKKAADAMLSWNKPAELIKRRQKERKLFMSGA